MYVKNTEDIIPRALAYKQSIQTIGDSETTIEFEAEEYDTANAFSLDNDDYTIPSDGYYFIHASIAIADINDTHNYYVYINIDATNRSSVFEQASTDDVLMLTLTIILFLNQGNKITLSVDSDFDNSFWVADLDRLPHYTYIIIEKRT